MKLKCILHFCFEILPFFFFYQQFIQIFFMTSTHPCAIWHGKPSALHKVNTVRSQWVYFFILSLEGAASHAITLSMRGRKNVEEVSRPVTYGHFTKWDYCRRVCSPQGSAQPLGSWFKPKDKEVNDILKLHDPTELSHGFGLPSPLPE